MPPAENMDVEMIYRLAAVDACVDHYAIAFAQPLLPRNLRSRQQQAAQQFRVISTRIGRGLNVLPRNYKEVHRRLRVDIAERIAVLVAIHRLRRNLPFDDLAE